MRLIFLGPPAVGKGTHAGDAARHYGIPKISTGDILREEAKKKTEQGRRVKEIIERGELVPDKIIIEILKEKISQPDCKKGFILDGFPRTIEQAEALDKTTNTTLVVNFQASHETLMARMTNRLTCRKCEAIFNTLFVKPKKEGVCDRCGGELYQREDQKPDVVDKRLKVYRRETEPLIDYYKKKGLLVDFNAEGPKKEVSERLFRFLDEKLPKEV